MKKVILAGLLMTSAAFAQDKPYADQVADTIHMLETNYGQTCTAVKQGVESNFFSKSRYETKINCENAGEQGVQAIVRSRTIAELPVQEISIYVDGQGFSL